MRTNLLFVHLSFDSNKVNLCEQIFNVDFDDKTSNIVFMSIKLQTHSIILLLNASFANI